MECWKEVFQGKIPKGKYQILLKNGEKSGLSIELTNKLYLVNIYFGAVQALRMLDEGIILNDLFDEAQIQKYKADGFENIIYKVEGGEFEKFIQNIGRELCDYLGLKHYIIITQNYVIEVMTEWEPEISYTQIQQG